MNAQMQTDVMLGTQLACSSLKSTPAAPEAILLSGTTGFLGAFLLQELLAQRKAPKVTCLVRAKDDDEALARIQAAARSYNLDTARLGDISAIAADISCPLMGLSPHGFHELAGAADTIIHAAAHVNLVLPYRVMRKSNVLGTHAMLRLCSTGVKKSFHFVSSVAVLGSANRTHHEDFVVPQNDTVVSGYAQSKWVAEQLVVSAADRGVPTCIYRPGLITGHSKTGIWHTRDALSLKLLTCMRLRTVPTGNEDICMTPIDYVSTAIQKLATRADGARKAYHLVNRCTVSWQQVTRALLTGNYVDRTVSHSDWMRLLRARLNAHPKDVDLARAASLFSMITPAENRKAPPDIDDTNTQHALRNADVPCPRRTAELLPTYLRWLSARG